MEELNFYYPNFPKFIDFLIKEESYFSSEIIGKIAQGEYTKANQNSRRKSRKKSNLTHSTAKENNMSDDEDDDGEDWASDGAKSGDLSDSSDIFDSDDQSDGPELDGQDLNNYQEDSIREESNGSKLKRSYQQFERARIPRRLKNVPRKKVKKTVTSISEQKSNIIEWNLTNNQNSCRYSSFWTLYRFKLYYIHPAFRTSSRLKDSTWLNKFISLNNGTMNTNKNAAIEEFAIYNYEKNLEIDQYGTFGAIAPLFTIFECLKLCKLGFADYKQCSECKMVYPASNAFVGPLFSLAGSDQKDFY